MILFLTNERVKKINDKLDVKWFRHVIMKEFRENEVYESKKGQTT